MPEPSRVPPTYELVTAPRSTSRTATAAIAIFELRGDPEPLRSVIGTDALPEPGAIRLVNISGIDHALVCRVDPSLTQIHTHAGPYVIQRFRELFDRSGIACRSQPEGGEVDLIEYWLAAAPSPLAIDPLLSQSRIRRTANPPVADTRLNRLLLPPLVVAVGRPNAGKSSLLNALARRGVAVVSDQPGTTRDSVGALLELDGLAVRWLDLPGIRRTDDPIESQAIRSAMGWATRADLVLHCDPAPDPAPIEGIRPDLIVRTMADLSPQNSEADLVCSAHTGQGLPQLAQAVRQRLLPDEILTAEGVWDLPHPSDMSFESPT